MVGNLPRRSACHRLVQARLLSFMSQYQVSVRASPCAVGKPSAATSLANTKRPARLWPPLVMPNSAAWLIGVMVAPPAMAGPMPLARDDFACSRNEEKALLLNG